MPTVAIEPIRIRRISPDCNRIVAKPVFLSFLMSVHEVPAARASLAPSPGWISTLCTMVPTGMFANGKALPVLIGALGPWVTGSPGCMPSGASM
eukprot:CAMPEP_0114296162 /NCGR_PEP_ID=MMETSP0059-20121206/11167_1 /TAXON_ID=36894 /ORGANISM="Pyramimonas parkeae, Strain CCMP726" /LENGTH=93 /DNA_ID=CAMNT_0001418297 /DNA_START=552 /DNA_END=833 /DNA_ORIENTATION=+